MTRTFNTLAMAALTLTLAAPLAYAQGGTPPAGPRIAYINSTKIMEQTPGRAELEALLAKEMAPFDAKIKAIVDSNAKIMAKYRTDAPNLTADGKATREKEIGEKQRGWQLLSDSLNQKAMARKVEIEQPMMAALEKILSDIRQEDGYWMVIDVAAQAAQNGLIVAIDKNMEITDRVLARFKVALAALPKPGGATPASGAPVNTGTGVGGVKIPPPAGGGRIPPSQRQ